MESTTVLIPDFNVTEETLRWSLENSTSFQYENISSLHTLNESRDILSKAIISFFIFPILALIGLFGNISTIAVYIHEKEKTASIVFIIALAFSELLYILIRLLAHIYVSIVFLTREIRNVRPAPFFWLLLSKPFQKIGFLFVLVITIERVTAVWCPYKYRHIWTTKRAIITAVVVALIPLAELVVVVDFAILSINKEIAGNGSTATFYENLRFMYYKRSSIALFSFVYRVILEIVPIVFVSVLNIVIVLGIRHNSISNHQQDASSQQRRKREAKITKMLLSISILFVVLCGPYTILYTLTTAGYLHEDNMNMLAYEGLNTLMLVNNVVNFVVYGAFDSFWRKTIRKLCSCQN